jgi:hypothetical protein
LAIFAAIRRAWKVDPMTDAPSNSAPPPPLSSDATPAQASAHLALRTADKEWSAKLLAGDVATRTEFQSLSEKAAGADAAADAIGGVIPEFQVNVDGVSPADLAKAVSWLKTDGGLNDGIIRDIIDGTLLTAENKASVQRAWARRQADQGWIDKLLKGDSDVRHEFSLMCAALNAGIKEAA